MSLDCPLCPKLSSKSCPRVPGLGDPSTASVMIIGESPNVKEAKAGEPFIGEAGSELDYALRVSGISRADCYITYVVKCRLPADRSPEEEEKETCTAAYLEDELVGFSGRLIVALGMTAIRTMAPALGKMSIDAIHGIPYQCGKWTLLPMMHPSAGLVDPKFFGSWLQDREVLRDLIRNGVRESRIIPEFDRPEDKLPSTYLFVDTDYGCGSFDFITEVALDSELKADGTPLWIQISTKPGESYIFDVSSRFESYIDLKAFLESPGVHTIMHNAVFDGVVLAKLGIYPANIHDTMSMAYLLQEPQGLKALSNRLLNVPMEAYSDVVGPYTNAKVARYLDQVFSPAFRNLEEEHMIPTAIRAMKSVTRILGDWLKDPDTNVWRRWNDQADEIRELVEYAFGPALEADLTDVPREKALFYAGQDPDVTLQVFHKLKPRLQESSQWETYLRDMRMIPMLIDMKHGGIKVDKDKFHELSVIYREEEDKLLEELIICHGAPEGFSPDSPKQVAEYLFNTLKLKRIKQTKTGADSTDVEVLSKLAPLHPAAHVLQLSRQMSKLRTTYADNLPKQAVNGSIHPDFTYTRTVTGRLSSFFMNIPNRTKLGRRIREGFIPSSGCWFVSQDYSQVELRIAAHRAQEMALILSFINGEDPHAQIAAEMFEVPLEEVDNDTQRRPAKTIQFGILNVISAEGLQRELIKAGIAKETWPVERCQWAIDRWFTLRPNIKAYLEESVRRGRQFGYVEDMWGRHRPVNWIKSQSTRLQREAERQASNGDIQSSAQGIMKQGMGDLVPVYRKYAATGFRCRPLLQVHDDVMMEVADEIVDGFVLEMQAVLENAAKSAGEELSTGLKVDVKVSPVSWGEMRGLAEWREILARKNHV